MKLLVASFNKKKLLELQTILKIFFDSLAQKDILVNLVSLESFPRVREVEEDGLTFEENAEKKSLGYAKQTGLLTFAEDSGLSIDALGGKPGVYSARFAGEGKNDLDNCRKVIELIKDLPEEKRTARFESAVSIASPDAVLGTVRGAVEGVVIPELRGSGGFGYDPLFFYPPFQKTLAEVSAELKNTISHRKKAIELSQPIISKYFMSRYKKS